MKIWVLARMKDRPWSYNSAHCCWTLARSQSFQVIFQVFLNRNCKQELLGFLIHSTTGLWPAPWFPATPTPLPITACCPPNYSHVASKTLQKGCVWGFFCSLFPSFIFCSCSTFLSSPFTLFVGTVSGLFYQKLSPLPLFIFFTFLALSFPPSFFSGNVYIKNFHLRIVS